MSKILISESQLMGALRKLIGDFLDQNENVIFNHKNLGRTDATLKMSLKLLRYDKKMDNGKNVFEAYISIDELTIHHVNDISYTVKSPVMFLPMDSLKHIESLLNKKISSFIPTAIVNAKFTDPSRIGYY